MVTQKAYRLHCYGGPECLTLDDVEVPNPGPSQVLIAVSAVGINPFDWKLRHGELADHSDMKLPAILGVDFVGTVVALGEGSWRFEIGDRVMSISNDLGAYAEHIAIDEEIVSRLPANMTDHEALALPLPAMTAWTALYAAGDVTPGMRVLVQGASGTAGAFAVQFAKAAGAHVTGIASAKNRDYVISLGADDFIDYNTQRFEDVVKDLDLVLDFVLVGGAQDNASRSWSVVRPGGAYVTVSDLEGLVGIREDIRGYFPRVDPDAALTERFIDQTLSGELKTKIARVFPRDALNEALEISKTGGLTGRLILDFA